MATAKEIAATLSKKLYTDSFCPKASLYVFSDCAVANREDAVIETAWDFTHMDCAASFEQWGRTTFPVVDADAKVAAAPAIGTIERFMGPWTPKTGGPLITGLGDGESTPTKEPGLVTFLPASGRPATDAALVDAPVCYVCAKPTLDRGARPIVCARCKEET